MVQGVPLLAPGCHPLSYRHPSGYFRDSVTRSSHVMFCTCVSCGWGVRYCRQAQSCSLRQQTRCSQQPPSGFVVQLSAVCRRAGIHAVGHRLLRSGFSRKLVPVGFVADEAAQGHVSLKNLRFPSLPSTSVVAGYLRVTRASTKGTAEAALPTLCHPVPKTTS